MKYAYYPGCSLHSVAAEYEKTTQMVCKELGITLEEIPDWNCCGASSAHSLSHLAGLAVPTRNLVIAEEEGLDVVAPCAACYQRLVTADYELKHDNHAREQVEQVVGKPYKGNIEVKSVLEIITQLGTEPLQKALKKPLQGLKVACYYGCYLVKPPKIAKVDDAENPQTMEKIFEALGAEIIQWPFKTECCGGSLVFTNADVCLKLGKDLLTMARELGANCIVTPCPLCQPNLDMRQGQINKKYGTNINIPIFYFTELMALAFGQSKNTLPFNKHFVDPQSLLKDF